MTKGSEAAYQELLDELQKLGIKYEMVDHPAALTTAQADAYIADKSGVCTKSMFLKDKHKNFYLVIMDDAKRMDFKEFQDPAALQSQWLTTMRLKSSWVLKLGSSRHLAL